MLWCRECADIFISLLGSLFGHNAKATCDIVAVLDIADSRVEIGKGRLCFR